MYICFIHIYYNYYRYVYVYIYINVCVCANKLCKYLGKFKINSSTPNSATKPGRLRSDWPRMVNKVWSRSHG